MTLYLLMLFMILYGKNNLLPRNTRIFETYSGV